MGRVGGQLQSLLFLSCSSPPFICCFLTFSLDSSLRFLFPSFIDFPFLQCFLHPPSCFFPSCWVVFILCFLFRLRWCLFYFFTSMACPAKTLFHGNSGWAAPHHQVLTSAYTEKDHQWKHNACEVKSCFSWLRKKTPRKWWRNSWSLCCSDFSIPRTQEIEENVEGYPNILNHGPWAQYVYDARSASVAAWKPPMAPRSSSSRRHSRALRGARRSGLTSKASIGWNLRGASRAKSHGLHSGKFMFQLFHLFHHP